MAAPGPSLCTDAPAKQCTQDSQLPPVPCRVRTARQEEAGIGSKSEDAKYAVSPSTPLLVTKMQNNLYIWGDTACAAACTPSPTVAMPCPNPLHPASGSAPPPLPKSTTRPPEDHPQISLPNTAVHPAGICGVPAGRWAALSLGDGHAAAITARGELLTWGRDTHGQCGHERDTPDDRPRPTGRERSQSSLATPQLVHFPTMLPRQANLRLHVQVRAVVCGGEHTLAITTAGVFAWGANALGQCGLGDGAPDAVLRPTSVPGLRTLTVSQLAAGNTHSLALTASSQVLSWGDGASGQLGLGDRQARRAPVLVEALWALSVVQIAAGEAHSAAVTSSGHAFAWGCNYFGQLGLMQEPEPWPRGTGQAMQPTAGDGDGARVSQVEQAQGCSLEVAAAAAETAGAPAAAGAAPALFDQGGATGVRNPGRRDVGQTSEVAVEARRYQEQQAGQQLRPLAPGRNLGSPRTPRGSGALGGRSCGAHPNLNSPRTPRTPFTPGSARRAAVRRNAGAGRANPQWLLSMVEMGIPARHAQIALEETGNAGVEVATEWLFATDRSAILDDASDVEDARSPQRGSHGPHAAAEDADVPPSTCVEAHAGAAGSGGCGGQSSCGGAGSPGADSGEEAWYGSPADGDFEGGSGWWDDLVVPEPRRVPLKDVRFLAAGARHTVAVTDLGVYSWGEGGAGALGLGDRESRDLPCRVEAFSAEGEVGVTVPLPPPLPAVLNPQAAATAAAPPLPPSASLPYVRSRLGNASGVEDRSTSGGGGSGSGGSRGKAAAVPIQRVACGAQHTLFLAQDGAVYWCGTMPYGAPAAAAAAGGVGVGTAPHVPLPPAVWQPQNKEEEGKEENAGKRCEPTASRAVTGATRSAGSTTKKEEEDVAAGGSRVAFSAVPRRLELGVEPIAGRVRPPTAGTAAVAEAPVVSDIVARGATSAVLMCSPRELPQVLNPACGPRLLDKLRTAITSAARARASGDLTLLSANLKAVTTGVRTVLSSPAAISAAFGRRSGMGLDGQLLEDVLTTIRQLFGTRPGEGDGGGTGSGARERIAGTVTDLHRFSVVAALQSAATALVQDLADHVGLLGTPERAQVLLAALQHPLLSEPHCARQLLPKLAATVMAAPPVVRTWLVHWWSEYPGPLLESRVVAPLQAFLTRELGATKKLTTALMDVIKVLARVAEAASLSTSLPPEVFYNKLISEKLDVQDHYSAWRQARELSACREVPREAPFSFCSYPFLLNARAKSHLLHLEARFQMEQSVAHARMEVQLYGRSAAAQRRAAEGLVLVKPAGPADLRSGGNNMNGGCSSSSSRSGGNAAGGTSGSACSSSSSNFVSSSSIIGGSLRSFFALLRRRRSSPGGGGGSSSRRVDDTRGRDQHGKPRGSDSDGSSNSSGGGGGCSGAFELPSPSHCQVPGVHPDMCILRVRRTHLVEDALSELGRQARRDLLKPLRVHFIGEEGIDAGGVKKEFFALLMDKLLSLNYGMMSYDEASRTYWFNPASLEPTDSYFLLGLVLGLAVYNRVLLAFPAPLLLYQKLRGGRELGLRDLEGWQPDLARGLKQLLEYDGPEPMSEVFGLTFSVDVDRFGHIETVPLKPGGELIPVTEDNRAEYVGLLAAWHMGGSVAAQFEAFAAGFRVLCGGPAMSLFNAQELERLVCGNPRLDFVALRDAARYDGGYSRDTPVVRWLWEIVLDELSVEDQRAFLKFFTGSDRSPLGGLGTLRPVLQRDGPDSHKLPTAHTCFNTLLMPEYSSRDKLVSLLRLAINNSEGFGLQ